jgi:hypothetical protein
VYAQGACARGAAMVEEALALAREAGDDGAMGEVHYHHATLLCKQGDRERAARAYRESLRVCHRHGFRTGMIECLEGLAGLHVDVGRPERAARIWGSVATARTTVGLPLRPRERPRHDRQVEVARAMLGADGFAQAWAEGQLMDLEQATRDLLAESTSVRPTDG